MRAIGQLCVLCAILLPAPSRAGTTGDATSSGSAHGGKFEIRGVTGNAWHIHGGAPASLGHAEFVFENRGDKPRKVTVTDVEFLRGNKDCEHAPHQVVSHPKFGGIWLNDSVQRESTTEVVVKPGASQSGAVGFTSVSAYYVYCDRFSFRVHFLVDGVPVVVTDEVVITREEPLRPRGE